MSLDVLQDFIQELQEAANVKQVTPEQVNSESSRQRCHHDICGPLLVEIAGCRGGFYD